MIYLLGRNSFFVTKMGRNRITGNLNIGRFSGKMGSWSWGWSSGSDVHWLFVLGRWLGKFRSLVVEMSTSVMRYLFVSAQEENFTLSGLV